MKKALLTSLVVVIFIGYAVRDQVTGLVSNTNAPLISPTAGNATLTATPLIATIAPTTIPSTPVPTTTTVTQATPKPTPVPTPKPQGMYKDGSYVSDVVDAYYGNVQVRAIISGGKISDVQFMQSPNDRSTSREINSQAMPMLTAEAIQAQSANVDVVSGASSTSAGFIKALGTALSQAKI